MSDPHDPWPLGSVQRWDLNEPHRHEPDPGDQSRFCLHPAGDHGVLGCDTCGCPRSEDDHLGQLCRWPGPEVTGARDPWVWRVGAHIARFPDGMLFEPERKEVPAIKPWYGSLADLLAQLGPANVGKMWPLDKERNKVGEPLELLGPFYCRHEDGRIVEFVAWGGLLRDHAEPVLEARSVHVTPLDAEGRPTGPAAVLTGVRDLLVSLRPVVEDTAVALGHMARATMEFNVALKSFASRKVLHAFYLADAVLMWIKGRPVWVHRSWIRPMPCWGLTRRQRASRRRIHRRGSR